MSSAVLLLHEMERLKQSGYPQSNLVSIVLSIVHLNRNKQLMDVSIKKKKKKKNRIFNNAPINGYN